MINTRTMDLASYIAIPIISFAVGHSPPIPHFISVLKRKVLFNQGFGIWATIETINIALGSTRVLNGALSNFLTQQLNLAHYRIRDEVLRDCSGIG